MNEHLKGSTLKLNLVASVAVGLSVMGLSACEMYPHSDPIHATVDRTSPINEKVLGSHGGSYFTIKGDITKTYECPADINTSCATLRKGDKIVFSVKNNSDEIYSLELLK